MRYSRGATLDYENSPYRTKFVGDKVYTFPSLKQMEVFSKDVQNIVNVYSKGIYLYDADNKAITKVEDAIESAYNNRYGAWINGKEL